MTTEYEIRIYAVRPDFVDDTIDYAGVEQLDDKKFIETAENYGESYTLHGFLRQLEDVALGYENCDTVLENMSFRAFLIDINEPESTPGRIDLTPYQVLQATMERVKDTRYKD